MCAIHPPIKALQCEIKSLLNAFPKVHHAKLVAIRDGSRTGNCLVGSSLLVTLGRDVMLLLVLLVTESIDASGGARAERCVAVLSNRLVAFLGSGSGGACRWPG